MMYRLNLDLTDRNMAIRTAESHRQKSLEPLIFSTFINTRQTIVTGPKEKVVFPQILICLLGQSYNPK